MKKKVYVGISGGVDSAVAAYLLLQQGFDVTGVFMKNWSGDDYGIADSCPWEEDLKSSIEVCEFLKIPHKTFNFEEEYRALVIEEFFREYKLGNTPNPDILCNKYIKFDLFLRRCVDDGADYIATGHYAKCIDSELIRAKDQTKDQTYFLSKVKQDQLAKTIFPLGDYLKKDVREIAKKIGLPNADRKDSQGICFVGKVDMGEFLRTRIKEKKGEFVDIDTNQVVGEHFGVYFYTIGQRKGLNIGGLNQPYFVAGKDIDANIVYLAKGKDHKSLWTHNVEFENIELIDKSYNLSGSEVEAMIRYRSEPTKATVQTLKAGKGIATFSSNQWAKAKGQSIVFYRDNVCLGCADIA